MSNIRVAMVELGLLCAAVMISLPVQAQTATPTVEPTLTSTLTPVPTPTCTPRAAAAPCRGAKLQVTWFSKDPSNARIFVSATGCPTIPICTDVGVADGDLVSVPPLTVTITDSQNHSLIKQVTDPGVNAGGCPGGKDTYRAADRLRLIYGAATTLLTKAKIPLAQPAPPTLIPPISVAVRDACGSLINATVNTCFPKVKSTMTSLKCFQ
jgi:hypothetical protein